MTRKLEFSRFALELAKVYLTNFDVENARLWRIQANTIMEMSRDEFRDYQKSPHGRIINRAIKRGIEGLWT